MHGSAVLMPLLGSDTAGKDIARMAEADRARNCTQDDDFEKDTEPNKHIPLEYSGQWSGILVYYTGYLSVMRTLRERSKSC